MPKCCALATVTG